MASSVPRDPSWDSTFALLREGYRFLPDRFRRIGRDILRIRLMGMQAVCLHGPGGAAQFYDETKFQRSGAIPRRVRTTLFGQKAVHTLDDEDHRFRKTAFLALTTPERVEALIAIMAEEWHAAIARWATQESITLFAETQSLLTRAVCRWAGVPLAEAEVGHRTRDFAAMIAAFGGAGPRLWRGKLARHRAQRWIRAVIEQARARQIPVASGSALQIAASFRERDGRLLDTRIAAVELINVLRPTVAIAWYISFAAAAIHRNPGLLARLRQDDAEEYAGWFMQEIRRYYPFAPFLGARVRRPFSWEGFEFPAGMLVLLDVYGTHHDARWWPEPEKFEPERFQNRQPEGFDFIPQGGGSPASGHRCPGEEITRRSVALALRFLSREMTFEFMPGQDLSIDLTKMPTQPRSGVILRVVKGSAFGR